MQAPCTITETNSKLGFQIPVSTVRCDVDDLDVNLRPRHHPSRRPVERHRKTMPSPSARRKAVLETDQEVGETRTARTATQKPAAEAQVPDQRHRRVDDGRFAADGGERAVIDVAERSRRAPRLMRK